LSEIPRLSRPEFKGNQYAKGRRSLKYIQMYPRVQDIFNKLQYGESLDYKSDMEHYLRRDKALVALTYLLAGRISEVLRLEKKQFIMEKEIILVQAIKLSKSKLKNRPRKNQYRQEAFLALTGERAKITQYVLDYLLNDAPTEGRIFKFGTRHALRITIALTQEPCHWLRAYGENYLYDHWDHDILAVADYVKVDPRTLANYIRRSYAKYKPA